MKNRVTITYQDRLLICFLAGVLGGTIIANLLGGEMKQQIGYFDTLFLAEQGLNWEGKRQMWLYVLRQRGLEFLGGWLLSVTVFSIPGFYVLSLMAGGSIAVVLSVITVQKGVMGLVFYLASVMPHALCYIPIALILASWAGEEHHLLRPLGLSLLVLLLVVGTASEAWLSPVLLHFFTNV
ncbi:MAG: stage II sporulation protein M [Hungatella hathewayi]|nr:stage II sporulation protein M [Hungatella hathewayi]